MFKRTYVLLLPLLISMMLTGCSNSINITLNLSTGDYSGKYIGDLHAGNPDGFGKFISQNEEGLFWTYEGEFKEGHFDGNGIKTFENGEIVNGIFENDELISISPADMNLFFIVQAAM